MTTRYITGCDAVHPDRRGGQHVAKHCTSVLAIDDDAGVGVLVNSERSQSGNRQKADAMLAELRARRALDLTSEDREALSTLAFLLHKHSHEPYAYDGEECAAGVAVLDRILAGRGG